MEADGSFWDHLEEFRKTILLCIAVVVCGSVLSFVFYDSVLEICARPLLSATQLSGSPQLRKTSWKRESLHNPTQHTANVAIPPGAIIRGGEQAYGGQSYHLQPGATVIYDLPRPDMELAVFGPTEGMMVALRVSLWVGLVLTSPMCLFLLLRFVSPGLHGNERRLIFPFIGLSCLFIALGITFAYTATLPLANRFLFAFNSQLGHNLWSLGNYMSFTLFLLLAHGLAFELVVVLLFLIHLSVISAQSLRDKRRHAIVGICVLSALLTPPDVVTQLLLAAPMIALYELTIVYARVREYRALAAVHVD